MDVKKIVANTMDLAIQNSQKIKDIGDLAGEINSQLQEMQMFLDRQDVRLERIEKKQDTIIEALEKVDDVELP